MNSCVFKTTYQFCKSVNCIFFFASIDNSLFSTFPRTYIGNASDNKSNGPWFEYCQERVFVCFQTASFFKKNTCLRMTEMQSKINKMSNKCTILVYKRLYTAERIHVIKLLYALRHNQRRIKGSLKRSLSTFKLHLTEF